MCVCDVYVCVGVSVCGYGIKKNVPNTFINCLVNTNVLLMAMVLNICVLRDKWSILSITIMTGPVCIHVT